MENQQSYLWVSKLYQAQYVMYNKAIPIWIATKWVGW